MDGDLDDFSHVMDGLGYVRNLDRLDRELLFNQAVALMDWYLYDRELQIDPDYVGRVVAALIDPRALEGAFRLARQIKVPPEEIWLRRMETSVLAVLGQLRARGNWHRIMRELSLDAEPATELGRLEADFWTRRGSGGPTGLFRHRRACSGTNGFGQAPTGLVWHRRLVQAPTGLVRH
jgi:hypothetical protein